MDSGFPRLRAGRFAGVYRVPSGLAGAVLSIS
jgi:hypothetical protein